MSSQVHDITSQPWVVVGCGSIGKRHIANLRRLGIETILAVDPSEQRRREVATRPKVVVYSDLDDALGDGPGVVIVCSPTSLHVTHALAAAQADCHLFIEKPISDRIVSVDALVTEAQARNLISLVGCNFRFHPGLQRVHELYQQGVVGRVVSARAQFGQYLPDWHPWEDYRHGYSAQRALGGGVILDRVHELDYLTWLLGPVSTVLALAGHQSALEIDTEDVAEILLQFESGAFGSVHMDYIRRTYDCGLELVGETGTIQWSYQDRNVRWYSADSGCWHSVTWPTYDSNEMYLAQMRHFIACLCGEATSVLDVAGGKYVLELALAVKAAASEARPVQVGAHPVTEATFAV